MQLIDKNNKIIKIGDKVKFWAGDRPNDPFGLWETGTIHYRNGIFIIKDDDAEWTAHNKELEIIE